MGQAKKVANRPNMKLVLAVAALCLMTTGCSYVEWVWCSKHIMGHHVFTTKFPMIVPKGVQPDATYQEKRH